MFKLFVALCLTITFHNTYAQAVDLKLDDELYFQKFSIKSPQGDKTIEFVRNSENLENWTKLIGFRYQQMPGADNDPSKVAIGMATILKARGMMSAVSENKKMSEAMIDFISRGKTNILEFNVFRYGRSKDGKAVISLQFAYRFTDTSEQNVQNILKLREAWTKQAALFDMNTIENALDQIN